MPLFGLEMFSCILLNAASNPQGGLGWSSNIWLCLIMEKKLECPWGFHLHISWDREGGRFIVSFCWSMKKNTRGVIPLGARACYPPGAQRMEIKFVTSVRILSSYFIRPGRRYIYCFILLRYQENYWRCDPLRCRGRAIFFGGSVCRRRWNFQSWRRCIFPVAKNGTAVCLFFSWVIMSPIFLMVSST